MENSQLELTNMETAFTARTDLTCDPEKTWIQVGTLEDLTILEFY